MEDFFDKTIFKKIFGKRPEIMAVYAFGSRAGGLARKESDFDLAIMVKDKNRISPREILKLLLKGAQVPANLDLVCVDLSSSPLLLFQIIKNGFCLYEKDHRQKILLEAAIVNLYYDSQHLRDIYRQYLRQSLKKGTYGH